MSDTTPWTYHVVLADGTDTIMEVGPYPTALDALRDAARFVGMKARNVDRDVMDTHIATEKATITGPNKAPVADWHEDMLTHGDSHIVGYTIERYADGETDGSWGINGGLRATIREAVAA